MNHSQKIRRLLIAGLALLCLLLVFIAATVWQDQKVHSTQTLSIDGIENITLQRPGFDDIVLNRQAKQRDAQKADWKISAPCQLPANAQRITPLLNALQSRSLGYDANEVDLEAAGLTSPLATVKIDGQTISIGGTDLSGERRYIRRYGNGTEQIEFVPEWVLSLINGGLSALGSLEVFPRNMNSLQIEQDVFSVSYKSSSTEGDSSALSAARASAPEQSHDSSKTQPATSKVASSFAITGNKLTQWAAATAQQIVQWPLTDGSEAESVFRLLIKEQDTARKASVYTYKNFTAVHYDQSNCAYILSAGALPSITH